VLGRFDAARVLLRPASAGTGVIAGGGVRAVLELGGIRDVLAKSLGTTNPINMLKAAESALKQLRRPEDVAKARGKTISEVLPYRAPVEPEETEAVHEPVAEAAPVADAPAPALADIAPEPEAPTEVADAVAPPEVVAPPEAALPAEAVAPGAAAPAVVDAPARQPEPEEVTGDGEAEADAGP